MKTVGFLISEKENENRRAITMGDIDKIKNKEQLYFQKGYGDKLGFSDDDLIKLGCKVVEKEDIFSCDIICDPKIGDSLDLDKMKGKTIFGWIHATQNYDITQRCIDNKLTVYAWEKMYDGNRHIFYKNNQIAGQASVLHAMLCYGKQFHGLNVAILGNGNTSIGASNILHKLGAKVEIFNRKIEKNFVKEMEKFDVIVNCVLWDVNRKDHIVCRSDLKRLKRNSLIIDVSCDKNGAIESCIPTTVENPTYIEEGIMHYAVDHTPTFLFKDATESISKEVVKFLDDMIEGKENVILKDALIIENGTIIDDEINVFQGR